ncbi:MAG TPA: type VI secretion system tube protein Hcp [Gemmataceae bacterium]|nr:type VI secretion system tube protein Hcp [Gemmataceae bacterium]
MAQVDFFLDLPGIDGESTDSKYAKKIEIDSFSVSCAQQGTQMSGGGGGAGKVRYQDLHITNKIDKAGPKLMLACASGQHFETANLYCRKAGGEQNDFLKFTLTDVLVSSYQAGGHGHSEVLPVQQFSLNFGKIQMEYGVQDSKGNITDKVTAGWDVKANKKA